MSTTTKYLPKATGRTITGTWSRVVTPSNFKGISSHTLTAVLPSQHTPLAIKTGSTFPVFADSKKTFECGPAFYVVGGEVGARVVGDGSSWKYQGGKLIGVQYNNVDVHNVITPIGHGAVGLNGLLHVFGGRPNGGAMGSEESNDIWVLRDEKGGAYWQKLVGEHEKKPSARSYHAMAAWETYLYVFGGCSGHDRLNDLWRWDSGTGEWQELYKGGGGGEDGPCARGGAQLFVPNDGNSVYVLGGFNGAELDSCYRFDVRGRSWHPVASMPGARSVFGCANMGGGRAILFGGEVDPGTQGHLGAGTMTAEVLMFDPANEAESWQVISCDGAHQPTPRGWLEIARLSANRILVVGGLSSSHERLADAFILTIHF